MTRAAAPLRRLSSPTGGELRDLQDAVRAAVEGFVELTRLDPCAPIPWGVLIDQAEDLRRNLRDATRDAYGLLLVLRGGQMPDLQVVLAAAAAASSLDAATHAISPLATGLREDDRLPGIAQASLLVTGQFLPTAASALEEVAVLLADGRTAGTGSCERTD